MLNALRPLLTLTQRRVVRLRFWVRYVEQFTLSRSPSRSYVANSQWEQGTGFYENPFLRSSALPDSSARL